MRGFMILMLSVAMPGCLTIDANVNVPDFAPPQGSAGRPSPAGQSPPDQRYTPYGYDLDKVCRQLATCEKELGKRDWKELIEEIDDWLKYLRRLVGHAGSVERGDAFRAYCEDILSKVDSLKRSARVKDRTACGAALGRIDPILNRFSSDFPITEPIPPSERPPPAAETPAPGPSTVP